MALIGLGYIEIFLAMLCFFLFYYYRDSKYPINWPIFGMLPGALYHIQQIHERCTMTMRASGGTFLFKGPWFANMDMLSTVDPANVHYIMSANFMNFPKGPKFKEMFDVLGNGIFNADLDMWKIQRKTTRALITHLQFYKFLVKTSREKVEKGLIPVLDYICDKGSIVDLQDLFQRFTFDTTCILVTGYDPGCVSIDFPDVPFSKAMDDAEEAILFRHALPEIIWKLQRWLRIGEEKKLIRARETLDYTLSKYISKKREKLKEGENVKESEEGIDLLTFYLKEEENLGVKCDDKYLRDTILNLMIAGRDTTSSALTWFIWLVSTNPQVEKKIRDEINSIIPKQEIGKWRLFNVQELNKLVYLHGALCDSLRLYPPVPFQHKEPLENDILPSGHKVHPKLKIMFSLYAMGRMESIWGKDCLEFKPERWISDGGTIKHEPSYKFLAFNAGPRTCLGKEVAFTQMKAVAAAIIHNYQVELVKGHPIEPNASIILYMRHGFKVRISRRWP
ncbi:alkane hydroxylase MAH1-like [Nicotiana tabacum]|uniref:Alkane hydroxylase MAH1-like n=1 Tax=Nicotiana tabacum TaxID=4097 RepID=A0A1S4B869_TOBAC|nr:PREDICTED: alkane hydroxylase MAH1-like [Nicotiana tabacum]XP_016485081.1 PREDICTED: alkane hydroxylase MAH1-like [Nicotiana tabacum]